MPLPSKKTAEELKIKAGTKLICVKANDDAGLHINDVCVVVNNLRSSAPNIKNTRTGKVRFIPLHLLLHFEVLETLDNLEVGDIIVNAGGERKVLAAVGEVIVLSYADDFDGCSSSLYTVKELKKYGYKLKTQPDQTITEVTKEQIAEKMGIPIEQLRIKEN